MRKKQEQALMEKLMEQEAMMEQQDQKVRSRQVLQVGCVHLFFLTARNLQLCVELELPRLRAAQKCGLWKFSPFVGKAKLD